jgi:hypothetical protein
MYSHFHRQHIASWWRDELQRCQARRVIYSVVRFCEVEKRDDLTILACKAMSNLYRVAQIRIYEILCFTFLCDVDCSSL